MRIRHLNTMTTSLSAWAQLPYRLVDGTETVTDRRSAPEGWAADQGLCLFAATRWSGHGEAEIVSDQGGAQISPRVRLSTSRLGPFSRFDTDRNLH